VQSIQFVVTKFRTEIREMKQVQLCKTNNGETDGLGRDRNLRSEN